MGISLCVLRADTFMCLLLDGIEVLLCTLLLIMKGSGIIFKIFLIPEFWFLGYVGLRKALLGEVDCAKEQIQTKTVLS